MEDPNIQPNSLLNAFDGFHSSANMFRNPQEVREEKHRNFQIRNYQQYLEDKKKVIVGLMNLEVPSNIIDELSIIIYESQNFHIEFSFPYPTLDNVISYISTQKRHLCSIRSKLGNEDRVYLRVSSSVVELGMITIMCVLNEVESSFESYNSDLMVSHILEQSDTRKIFDSAYNAVKMLSTFDKEYGYDYKRFTPCKQAILNSYFSKYSPVKSRSGCLSIIVILLASTITMLLL